MPFYTDGEKFGYSIDDVIVKPKKKRVTKKMKAQKEAEDGADVEAE